MKTAMQEAIELVKEYNNRIIPYNVLLGNLELLLEKEKEQIMQAHAFGADDVDSNGGLLLRGVKNAIYYYNQAYNN